MKKDRLHALSFALVETALYLNGHPKDKRALEYYEKVSKEYKAELERYERENGPVSLSSDTVTDGNKWQWVNTPWPWQNEKAERGN